ncbi:MAG: hypothetical protein EAZ88_25160 [Oscillatoriales cyanobacterium]|nr:MAG: hypothetical protein EAZ88_25160 [Oscillatoriales cyanobacterium]
MAFKSNCKFFGGVFIGGFDLRKSINFFPPSEVVQSLAGLITSFNGTALPIAPVNLKITS